MERDVSSAGNRDHPRMHELSRGSDEEISARSPAKTSSETVVDRERKEMRPLDETIGLFRSGNMTKV